MVWTLKIEMQINSTDQSVICILSMASIKEYYGLSPTWQFQK